MKVYISTCYYFERVYECFCFDQYALANVLATIIGKMIVASQYIYDEVN